MYVIIQLCCSESIEVKSNWMNFVFFIHNQKNRSGGECFLKRVESITTGGIELLENILLDKACQRNNNFQVVEDELVIEISEI